LDFIRELFEKLYEQKEEREQWLIMDNCSIHDKEQTMSLAGKWGVKVMYLPAYSPQLNPIEMWFHELKTKVRKINYSGEKQLLEIMHRTLKTYEDHDFSNYYHGSLKFV
jgi:transposase